MRRCAASCAHRRFVREYQAERHRQEIDRETATGGYATEMAEHPPLVTFKKWLIANAMSDDTSSVFPDPNDQENPYGDDFIFEPAAGW